MKGNPKQTLDSVAYAVRHDRRCVLLAAEQHARRQEAVVVQVRADVAQHVVLVEPPGTL